MRDLFISAFEKLVTVFIVIAGLFVLLGTLAALFGGGPYGQGGFMAALMIFVFGSLYVILMGGMAYLGLGIYHNTRRSAEALEALRNQR